MQPQLKIRQLPHALNEFFHAGGSGVSISNCDPPGVLVMARASRASPLLAARGEPIKSTNPKPKIF
jgi:hypothetical protein